MGIKCDNYKGYHMLRNYPTKNEYCNLNATKVMLKMLREIISCLLVFNDPIGLNIFSLEYGHIVICGELPYIRCN